MSASDNLSRPQWEQLPMFMFAGELKGKANYSDDGLSQNAKLNSRVWDKKLKESKKGKNSLYKSIESEGVKEPIEVRHHLNKSLFIPANSYEIYNGHHRLAAAAAINPNMLVPVDYKVTKFKKVEQ